MTETTQTDHAQTPRHPAATRQKVPPFARYKGTSAWRKDKRRVRAYALFKAAAAKRATDGHAPTHA